MLPKQYRLPAFYIPELLKKGKRFNSENFTIIFTKQKNINSKENSKFLIIIPKKTDKRAVIRNRIKRKMREIIKARFDKPKFGYNVIVMARKNVIANSWVSINTELDKILTNSGLIN